MTTTTTLEEGEQLDRPRAVVTEEVEPRPTVMISVTDLDVRRSLAEMLLMDRYPTSLVETPATVGHRIELEAPDCLIVDVSPGTVEAISQGRESGEVAVLAITPPAAKGPAKRVKEMADEFMLFPFTAAELTDRIESAITSAGTSPEGTIAVTDPDSKSRIEIDPNRRHVTVDGHEVTLTVKEFDLLLTFAKDPTMVLRKAVLMKEVWGFTSDDSGGLETHIFRLRRKLSPEDPGRWIHSTHGFGYALHRRK